MLLHEIYSDQATHFHHTRKKSRPEMEYFVETCKNLPPHAKLVDLGCGSGRVAPWLHDIRPDINYRGVDNAEGFIKLAKQEHSRETTQFLHDDMLSFLKQQPQQSIDCIMAIASIQHLASIPDRQEFFALAYRALEYGGSLCLVNWSYSERFLGKYRRQIIASCYHRVLS